VINALFNVFVGPLLAAALLMLGATICVLLHMNTTNGFTFVMAVLGVLAHRLLNVLLPL